MNKKQPTGKRTFRRNYIKISPNFPPDLEQTLRNIVKNATLDDIMKYAPMVLDEHDIGPPPLYTRTVRKFISNPGENESDEEMDALYILAEYLYGEIIAQCGVDVLKTNDIVLLPFDGTWQFMLRSLSSATISGGIRIFYSLRTDKLTYNGTPYQLAFTQHCIDRIHQRFNGSHCGYGHLGNLFAYLYNNNYFEWAELSDGAPALSLFAPCWDERYGAINIVKAIYGDDYYTGEKYHYRIGYLPVEIKKEFMLAKTMLCPGYVSTPEFELLRKSELNNEWLKRAQENENHDNLEDYDPQLIRALHMTGIPQVKIINEEIIRFKEFDFKNLISKIRFRRK